MTRLHSKVKQGTILKSIFGRRSKLETSKETAFDGEKAGTYLNEDNYPEIEVIEVPIFKRMLFQFNKPVKLEFS